MDSDEQFDRLARRDTELTTLAVRGRRRALEIMVLMYLPSPFIVMKLNHDTSLASVIPIALACLGGVSYSWAKWRRRPEDSQSVAFLGLDRKRRGATYRSMWRGTAIDDPVVVTIVEAIDCHLRRSVWPVVAAVVAVAAMAIGLVEVGGFGAGAMLAAIVIGVLAAAVIAAHRWVMNRVGLVLDEHRPCRYRIWTDLGDDVACDHDLVNTRRIPCRARPPCYRGIRQVGEDETDCLRLCQVVT